MRALGIVVIVGLFALFALSLVLLAGVATLPTIHFFGAVPLVMLLCVGLIFAVVRR